MLLRQWRARRGEGDSVPVLLSLLPRLQSAYSYCNGQPRSRRGHAIDELPRCTLLTRAFIVPVRVPFSETPAAHVARRPCGIIPDFWPRNRALARDPPLLDAGRGFAFEKSPGRLIRFAPKALRNAAGRTRFVPELGLLARNCGFSRTRSSRFVGFYVEKARSAVEPGLARACARQISSSDSLWSGASEGSRPTDGAFRGAGPEPCAAIRPGLRQQRFNRDGSDFVEKGAFRRLGQRNRSPLAYGGVMVGYWRDGKVRGRGRAVCEGARTVRLLRSRSRGGAKERGQNEGPRVSAVAGRQQDEITRARVLPPPRPDPALVRQN